MKAILHRNADTEFGVFGRLSLYDDAGHKVASWCTAEDDWLDNQRSVSCIPPGTYLCRRTVFQKHSLPTFEITGVPGRSRILLHPGNTEEDVEGCVLLGMDFGATPVKDEDDPKHPVRLKWSVARSREAFAEFMGALTGIGEFPLEVQWAIPGSWRAA